MSVISMQERKDRVWYRVPFDPSIEYEGFDLNNEPRVWYRPRSLKERFGFASNNHFLWKRTDPLRQRGGVKPVRYFSKEEMEAWCQGEVLEALRPMGISAFVLLNARLQTPLVVDNLKINLEDNLRELGTQIWKEHLRADPSAPFVLASTLYRMLKLNDLPIVEKFWDVPMSVEETTLPADVENYRNNTLIRRMVIAMHYSIPVNATLTGVIVSELEKDNTLHKFAS